MTPTSTPTLCLNNSTLHYYDTAMSCYDFDMQESILIIFGTSVTEKLSNHKMHYFPTSPNWCFCTTCRNAETQTLHLIIQMLYQCTARLQPVAGWIYSVLLFATQAHAAIWLSKSHSQCVKLSTVMGHSSAEMKLRVLHCVECKTH